MNRYCNIGIYAHVDAGKTTLTEQLLLKTGNIRKAGSVDKGTAHSDRLDVEKRRGISVQAACVPLLWKQDQMNIIDTPGHSDFLSEVERSMWVSDGAVLIVSAVDGVQPQTQVLYESLKRFGIPTLIFINKTDRENADADAAMEEIRHLLTNQAAFTDDDDAMMAALGEFDEAALEKYLEGELYPKEQLMRLLKTHMKDGFVPVLKGSALTGDGVDRLLDACFDFFGKEPVEDDAPGCGIVFAIEDDPVMGRGAYVRMVSGTLKNRSQLDIEVLKDDAYSDEVHTEERKITQIRSISVDGRGGDKGVLTAGEIGILYGLGNIRSGQVIGDRRQLPSVMEEGLVKKPLLMVKVVPDSPEKKNELRSALLRLRDEDPLLGVRELMGEMHINVMGTIQLEILQEQLLNRFGISVSFGAPQVIYRETIRQASEGFVAYTMPKPCWAVIKLLIEPAERGSGIRFSSEVPVRKIKERYQHQVEQGLRTGLRQGIFGWQVDDVAITLIDGSDHQFHTHPLDFIVAAPMALMDGLQRGGSQLLEPILEMHITLPQTLIGKVMSEIVSMKGETLGTEDAGNAGAVLTARVPLRTSVDFPTRLAAISGGRAALSMDVCCYRECEEKAECPRQGVNPLDTAKYILAARNAIQSEIY